MNTLKSILFILVLLVLSACAPVSPAMETPAPLPTLTPAPVAIADSAGMDPAAVVETFYRWYIDYNSGPLARNALRDGVLVETGYLTAEYLARIDEALATFGAPGGAVDVILWAQDIPDSVEVLNVDREADRAQAEVATSFAGHKLVVDLQLIDGRWLITDIRPQIEETAGGPPPASQPTAVTPAVGDGSTAQPVTVDLGDGQLYRNEEYGFQITYPEGWAYRENRSEPGQPPIGPESLVLNVMFMPQEWADAMDNRSGPPGPNTPVIAPFSLEVTVGSPETFRDAYTVATESEPMVINGVPGAREIDRFSDTLFILRYAVSHPGRPDVHLMLQDPISGFPDRLTDNEATVQQFAAMVETLEFLD